MINKWLWHSYRLLKKNNFHDIFQIKWIFDECPWTIDLVDMQKIRWEFKKQVDKYKILL